MTIDKMTLGEIKEILTLFGDRGATRQNPTIGKYCIVRCYSMAGVHAGVVESVDNENVVLKDSRRLFNWGSALSGVAQNGIKGDCKIDVVNPLIYLTGVCEIIPCTDIARVSIHDKK